MQNTYEPDSLREDAPNWKSFRSGDSAMCGVLDSPQDVECSLKTDTYATGLGVNRRRCTRRASDTSIYVYGSRLDGNPFYGNARTINVSVFGALLMMEVPVSKGQKLLLFNEATQRQQVCQIVDIRVQDKESLKVAVEFPIPHAEFWQNSPTRRKIPPHSKIMNRIEELKALGRTLSN